MNSRTRSTIALLLCAVLFVPVFALCADAVILGDLDADHTVTAYDARMILRAAVGLEKLDAKSVIVADIDCDGAVTAADARIALRTSVLLEDAKENASITDYKGYSHTVVDPAVMYTYDMLCNDLSYLQAKYPDRFSYSSLGETADGRNEWCLVIGTGSAKKQIVADAGFHGSEYLNPAAVMYFVEYYLRNYDTVVYNGKTVRQILADTDLYIMPMFNPDGIAISQFGLDGLRSEALKQQVRSIYNRNYKAGNTKQSLSAYLRVWKANANGVDLNRNYLFETAGTICVNDVKFAANTRYRGDPYHPENETAAYKALVNQLSNVVAAVSFHSRGNLIYWQCGQTGQVLTATKKLAGTVANITGYYQEPFKSDCHCAMEWMILEKGIPAVIVESGTGDTPLPISAQAGICNKLKNVLLAVAEMY